MIDMHQESPYHKYLFSCNKEILLLSLMTHILLSMQKLKMVVMFLII